MDDALFVQVLDGLGHLARDSTGIGLGEVALRMGAVSG